MIGEDLARGEEDLARGGADLAIEGLDQEVLAHGGQDLAHGQDLTRREDLAQGLKDQAKDSEPAITRTYRILTTMTSCTSVSFV